MVKHIILWTLKEMSDSEKESVKAGIKEGLEGLKGKIPGLIDIKVNTNGVFGHEMMREKHINKAERIIKAI